MVKIDNSIGHRIDSFKTDDLSVVLLDYKECSIEEFESAMRQKNADISTMSNETLFILYTKFKADAQTCSRARSSYAYGVGLDSSRKANTYKEELQRRGFVM